MPGYSVLNRLAAVPIVLCLSTPLFAEGNTKLSEDQIKVLSTIETMTRSFEAGNIDAVMATYEPGQSIAFQPGAIVSDSEIARQTFQQIQSLSPKFSYSGHEVIVEGDIALHVSPWSMTGTDPEGKPIQGAGLSVAVLRKQADGSWKMVIDNPHGGHLLSQENGD